MQSRYVHDHKPSVKGIRQCTCHICALTLQPGQVPFLIFTLYQFIFADREIFDYFCRGLAACGHKVCREDKPQAYLLPDRKTSINILTINIYNYGIFDK